MTPLVTLSFTIRYPTGKVEQLAVDSETALVGSGAHCEIRLPSEESPIEQLLVRAQPGGVFGQAQSMNPAALVNGIAFTQGRLLPESIVLIGRIQLSVVLCETKLEGTTRKKHERSASPLTYVAAIVGFPLGFFLLFTMQKDPAVLPKPVEPPSLFADRDTGRPCPQTAPGPAAALADGQLLLAEARRERAPFDPKDGILAADLYELAAGCFTLAGNSPAADQSKKQAAVMRKVMSDEFHIHRIRLERALATKNYEGARTEVHILLDFIDRNAEGDRGPKAAEYAGWLASLDRQIELKFAGNKKRK